MTNLVTFRHETSGATKSVKIGWSWTLFLLSGFFGVPLFMRGLKHWGMALLLTAGAVILPSNNLIVSNILSILLVAAAIFMGRRGNELTARHMLDHGWVFAEPQSEAAAQARRAWSLDQPLSPPFVQYGPNVLVAATGLIWFTMFFAPGGTSSIDSAQLEVRVKFGASDPMIASAHAMYRAAQIDITNRSMRDVLIQTIDVNGRTECQASLLDLKNPETEKMLGEFMNTQRLWESRAINLQVGEQASFLTLCNPVRAKIITNRGAQMYTFGER